MTRKDAVSPELAAYVLRRDGGCVVLLPRIAALGEFGPCRGRLTRAHVRDRGKGGMLGRRPPSVARHLVIACEGHHLDRPVVDLPAVRDELDRYLAFLEGPDQADARPWETIPRVRSATSMLPRSPGDLRTPPGGASSDRGRKGGTA